MREKPKANSVITHKLVVVDDLPIGITFVVKDAGEVTLELAKVSEGNRAKAMLHGFIQRVSDGAALSRNTETGLSATPGDKLAAMSKLVEHYNSGSVDWSTARTGGGGVSAELTLLVRALGELYPQKSGEQLLGWAKKRSGEERAALMMQENIKAIVERLRSSASANVDAGALLGELDIEMAE